MPLLLIPSYALYGLLVAMILSSASAVITGQEEGPDDSFFFHCSQGQVDQLRSLFADHPTWVHARTKDGETCLHLAGISGFADVTQLLLSKGADPNVRTTFDQGLRMPPLSWNVYGNHVDNARLLLEHGADVNMDFDLQVDAQTKQPVTVLDIIDRLSDYGKHSDFDDMKALLLKHGAKTFKELQEIGYP
jgi:Ankyrin repeat